MSESAYRVQIEDKAERELKSFEKKICERIARRIDQLILDPRGSNCKPLKDLSGIWRLRVGNYPVICEIKDTQLIVFVIRIAHRREAHRDLWPSK